MALFSSGNNTNEGTKSRGSLSRLLRWTVISIFIAGVVYYFVCGLTYSEGTRSGVLTKISKRGYLFKTFEGELNVGGLNQGDGTIMPLSIFYFSVPDEAVYKAIENAQGKKVVLHYKEVIHSFFWQGETDYFVYKAETVK